MKQRLTYLLPKDSGIDPSSIAVGADRLNFTNAHKAALEKRITVGLSELPHELASLFPQIHELHIRWSSPVHHKPTSPLVSRLPPGLHIFFTPRKEQPNLDICPALKQLFGSELKCHSTVESFSRPQVLEERFSTSSAYQYYQPLSHLRQLQDFLRHLPSCDSRDCSPIDDLLDPLESLVSFDLDFDTISHAVSFSTHHSPAQGAATAMSQGSNGLVRRHRPNDSVEVGVLQSEKPDEDEPESLKLGGYLTVLGENDSPDATLFSFPSRHHQLPAQSRATFRTSFSQPAGLHPKLEITLPSKKLTPPAASCALHAYLTLPSALIIDRYQLSDPLFLASQNLIALRSLSGEEDLEAPYWVIARWGSAALFELARPPRSPPLQGEWTITIPTHLRYLSSNVSSSEGTDAAPGQASLDIPWPVVFWACEAGEGLKMSTNPFDRVNLGYDGLFGPKTMFYHVPPAVELGDGLVERLSVPVLEPERAAMVQIGTLVAVLMGFGWVCWKLLRGMGETKGEKGGKIE